MSGPNTKRSGRQSLGLLPVLALLALALVAAACGGDSATTSSTPSATPGGAASWGPSDLEAIAADPDLKAMLPSGMTEIRVASDIPYPPWEYYVEGTKQPTGFDYDLSQAIGAKIGVPVSFNQTPFDGIILSLKAGKRDMIMSDMYDNAERQKVLDFVDYAYDGTSLLVKKGNPEGLTNLDSIAGKTVAVESGTTQQVLLQKLNAQFESAGKDKITILQLPNQPAALLAITSGRAVGDLTDHSTASYIAETTNDGNTFEVVTDPSAPNGYEPAVVGIGILKADSQLRDVVQQALQGLIDDGSYQRIIAAYGLLPVQSAQVNQGTEPLPSASPTS